MAILKQEFSPLELLKYPQLNATKGKIQKSLWFGSFERS